MKIIPFDIERAKKGEPIVHKKLDVKAKQCFVFENGSVSILWESYNLPSVYNVESFEKYLAHPAPEHEQTELAWYINGLSKKISPFTAKINYFGNNAELLCRNYDGYDLILCKSTSGEKYIYLGHWNDGPQNDKQ